MAEDETIFVSVMVEPQLPVVTINLDEFLPVGVLLRFVVLNQLKLVWESTTHLQLVNSASVL